MAMFDLGKRGSGSQQDQKEQKDEGENVMPEFGMPKGGVIRPPAASSAARSRDAAVIGPSIHVEGTLRGEEDLIIEGQVSGTVNLQGHSLTIGPHGQINANIYANTVVVDGTVEGDVFGAERVVIRQSANIRGNITSPRVSLEEGARFKGAIEMDAQAVEEAMGTRKGKSAATAGHGGPGSAGAASSRTESLSSPAASPSTATDKAGEADKSSSGSKASSSAG
jgi:cytoskeletal protein CcmA (bactofilin family)